MDRGREREFTTIQMETALRGSGKTMKKSMEFIVLRKGTVLRGSSKGMRFLSE